LYKELGKDGRLGGDNGCLRKTAVEQGTEA
jgi:hypothetical protein